eukprot:CAMPEP_0169208632 /NCGR_PEP_ID=MMETSP1016-20121227/14235_1 /TAXON_ID=342587 /ORGANISM="Karlodinium micrum, Strain CCMP2283" /LENGTH=369 /DNA_ID=CAMNT_0009286019 /DNA_START=1 /DNA_END=1110 /DNA_ORIENTATION=+
MAAMVHGGRWQPKDKCSRNASSLEDDFENRSTCSGTEASEDERPSRTSSTSVSVIDKREGQKWGRQLLGMLKSEKLPVQDDPPPPPPPPPLPGKTKLQSKASLFIPKSAQSQLQSWDSSLQAQQQGSARGNAFVVGSQGQTSSVDKEMFCWEYMHKGYCPRQSTCRWMHPPASSCSTWDSTYTSVATGGYAPQNMFAQAAYPAQPAFPQACQQVNFVSQVNVVPLDSSGNFAPPAFQKQITPAPCAPNFQSQKVPQIIESRNHLPCTPTSSVPAEPPLALPLTDLKNQPSRHSGFCDLHELDDTPWPDFMKDSRFEACLPQASNAQVSEVGRVSKTPTNKVSWADIQEDSDLEEQCLHQWQRRPKDTIN